jgi:hypothetical protein
VKQGAMYWLVFCLYGGILLCYFGIYLALSIPLDQSSVHRGKDGLQFERKIL